jgi:hypothetical protein
MNLQTLESVFICGLHIFVCPIYWEKAIYLESWLYAWRAIFLFFFVFPVSVAGSTFFSLPDSL